MLLPSEPRSRRERRASEEALDPETRRVMAEWHDVKGLYSADELVYMVREEKIDFLQARYHYGR